MPFQRPVSFDIALMISNENAGNRASWREITVKGLTVAPVHPILECVANNGDGTYTAYFGYQNDNAFVVTIPVGPDNKFSPNPENRSQPSVFQSGRSSSYPNAAFSVVFDGNNLVWTVWDRTASASRASKACS